MDAERSYILKLVGHSNCPGIAGSVSSSSRGNKGDLGLKRARSGVPSGENDAQFTITAVWRRASLLSRIEVRIV